MPTASRPKNSTRNRMMSMIRYASRPRRKVSSPSPLWGGSASESEPGWGLQEEPPTLASASRRPSLPTASRGEGEENWESSRCLSVIASASEAIQLHRKQTLDGFVALLLAMTGLNCFMIWPTLPSVRFQRHGATWTSLVRGNVADRHRFGIERKEVAIEADQIPSGHQKRPGRHRGRIKPHRKLQVRRGALVEQPRGFDDAPAVPGKSGAEGERHDAIDHFHPALHAWRHGAKHEVGPHMAVGTNELRGRQHDAPDDQVDDHLFGPGDRISRRDIAADDLHQADQHGGGAQHTDQEPLGLVPPRITQRLPAQHVKLLSPSCGRRRHRSRA